MSTDERSDLTASAGTDVPTAELVAPPSASPIEEFDDDLPAPPDVENNFPRPSNEPLKQGPSKSKKRRMRRNAKAQANAKAKLPQPLLLTPTPSGPHQRLPQREGMHIPDEKKRSLRDTLRITEEQKRSLGDISRYIEIYGLGSEDLQAMIGNLQKLTSA
jgi:hypothetical protein